MPHEHYGLYSYNPHLDTAMYLHVTHVIVYNVGGHMD